MGSFVELPLTLAPALERPTRRVIARVPCLGGLMAATPSGICRGRLNGNGGTSQRPVTAEAKTTFFHIGLLRSVKQSMGLRVPPCGKEALEGRDDEGD